jgi:hypothetical protein
VTEGFDEFEFEGVEFWDEGERIDRWDRGDEAVKAEEVSSREGAGDGKGGWR